MTPAHLRLAAIVTAVITLFAVTVNHLAPADATNWMLLSVVLALMAAGR